MNNKPLVSVIITTHNRVGMVGETIKSILNQDYPNLEIIVVDDFSTDETEEYFKKNFVGKIKYIRHEKNLGVQYASNTGYDHANGKYLAFLNDDDVWTDTDKLKKQVEIFENDKEKRYGTVTTSIRRVTPDKTIDKIIKKPKNLIKHILKKNGIIYASAALIRREAFELAGKFAEELPKGIDSDIQRRIILLGYDVYFIEKPMTDYYEGHTRMTSQNEKGLIKSICGENYKLQKYEYYYKIYPSSKSEVLRSIGNCYNELSKIKNKNSNSELAKKFYILSLKAYILNLRTWKNLIKLFIK